MTVFSSRFTISPGSLCPVVLILIITESINNLFKLILYQSFLTFIVWLNKLGLDLLRVDT